MPTISLRVSNVQKIELEARSARFEGNVSTYIKDALFGAAQDERQDLVARVESLVDDIALLQNGAANASNSATVRSQDSTSLMLSEVLILLRMALPPDKIRSARAELDRLAIPSWEPEQPITHKAESNRG